MSIVSKFNKNRRIRTKYMHIPILVMIISYFHSETKCLTERHVFLCVKRGNCIFQSFTVVMELKSTIDFLRYCYAHLFLLSIL